MAEFSVWAPNAKRVELVLKNGRHAMAAGDRGWFRVDVADAAAGLDYAFSLDGAGPLPDPRSPWQPEGVHRFSRTVNHAAFAWTDAGWRPPPLSSAVVYEMHVGTFTPAGTFDAAIDRLDHLVSLGVTHVELLPVNEFPGDRGWGYDGVDLFAPHHAYGGPDGLKRLIDACHRRGLAVVLDVVYNHLGPAGNYLERFGPYFDIGETPWGKPLNFGGKGSDEVRRFFLDNALMWLRDYHFDGLRLDAIHAYVDHSALHILEQMTMEVDELEAHLGRALVLIAESDLNNPRVVTPLEAGGFGIDAQWSDDFHHALHSAVTGETSGYYCDFGKLAHLATALKEAFIYAGQHSAARGRIHGRRAFGLPGWRFLAYLQNHDQIGNRAAGERVSHLASLDRCKIGAAFVLLSPFVPMLYMGEEWAASSPFQYFTDHEPELGKLVSEGRRREFGSFGWKPEDVPDPQDPATFDRSKLKWDEVDRDPHRAMLQWHRDLIALRKRMPALTDGRLENVDVTFDEQQQWLVMRRGDVTLAANFARERRTAPLPTCTPSNVLLASKPARASGDSLHLEPESVAILGPN